MSDAAQVVREAFPLWRKDPYQKTAVDSILRLLFAGENVQKALATLETALVYFVEDPPSSLSYGAPSFQAETLANRLEVLAREIRKSVPRLRDLAAYADQFNSSSRPEDADGGVRTQADGDQNTQPASNSATPF